MALDWALIHLLILIVPVWCSFLTGSAILIFLFRTFSSRQVPMITVSMNVSTLLSSGKNWSIRKSWIMRVATTSSKSNRGRNWWTHSTTISNQIFVLCKRCFKDAKRKTNWVIKKSEKRYSWGYHWHKDKRKKKQKISLQNVKSMDVLMDMAKKVVRNRGT